MAGQSRAKLKDVNVLPIHLLDATISLKHIARAGKDTTWVFDHGHQDGLRSAIRTMNGNIVAVGHQQADGKNEHRRAWAIRLDRHGNRQWSITLGGGIPGTALDLLELPNGHLLVIGRYRTDEHGYDIMLHRLDSHGKVLWEKLLHPLLGSMFKDMKCMDNGDIILLTGHRHAGSKNRYSALTRIDPNGEVQWKRDLKYDGHTLLGRLHVFSDDRLVLAGTTVTDSKEHETSRSLLVLELSGRGEPRVEYHPARGKVNVSGLFRSGSGRIGILMVEQGHTDGGRAYSLLSLGGDERHDGPLRVLSDAMEMAVYDCVAYGSSGGRLALAGLFIKEGHEYTAALLDTGTGEVSILNGR